MNRRRTTNQKTFVSGGIYDPNTAIKTNYLVQKQPLQQEENNEDLPMQIEQPDDVPPLEPPPENPFKYSALDLDEAVDDNGKVKFKKIFVNRKKTSVRAKEKRIRQNRRLRKTLIPKNGLMALNELRGVSISDFTISNNPGGGFTALVSVNNVQYEGCGNSKATAKNNACEKALRDFILAKLRENPRIQKVTNSGNASNEQMDTSDDNIQNSNNAIDDADDVPMINLASFAIYKLFIDWESEGYVIPEMHPAAGGNTSENEGSSTPREPKKASVRNELPANWETMHPASLLCIMRPGVTYIDKGTSGEKQNVVQSLGVTIDGHEFAASGRSKKLARRNVAAMACNTLFNTNFELDIKMESGAGH